MKVKGSLFFYSAKSSFENAWFQFLPKISMDIKATAQE